MAVIIAKVLQVAGRGRPGLCKEPCMARAKFVYDFENEPVTARRTSPHWAGFAEFMRKRAKTPF
jgi:hypothetical protein